MTFLKNKAFMSLSMSLQLYVHKDLILPKNVPKLNQILMKIYLCLLMKINP